MERLFQAASHQKAWDHFTKAQRKSLEQWKKHVVVCLLSFSMSTIFSFHLSPPIHAVNKAVTITRLLFSFCGLASVIRRLIYVADS
jgi:antibiotic biosynthesis monooxygenase (ABM) superfamily enzyme